MQFVQAPHRGEAGLEFLRLRTVPLLGFRIPGPSQAPGGAPVAAVPTVVQLVAAVGGEAKYIVTRDDDLKGDPEVVKAMAEHGIEILTVQRFLDLLDAPDQQEESSSEGDR